MRVLMITQRLDERDWLVSVIPRWINALAQQVDALDVLALEIGQYAPPANVRLHSMGKERGRSKIGKALAFYQAVLPLIGRVDAVFVHMIPRYALMVGPPALLARKPLALWYAHRHASLQLRLALPFCWRVITSAPNTFPLPTGKVRVVGQGIDMDFYSPKDDSGAPQRPTIIHVARLMPIKHQATLLRAVAAGVDADVCLIGDVPERQSAAYVEQLKSLAQELGIAKQVTFAGGLPPDAVRDWYRCAAVAVNLSPPGLFDKAALESMAAGVPTVVSRNPAFEPLLGEDAPRLQVESPDDVAGLATRLRALLALTSEERTAIGLALRRRVQASHSLERLIPRLVNVLKTGEP
jgi:glycosyltransferase involved in cell wall biosynthesis